MHLMGIPGIYQWKSVSKLVYKKIKYFRDRRISMTARFAWCQQLAGILPGEIHITQGIPVYL
jgi:hypothetical protein